MLIKKKSEFKIQFSFFDFVGSSEVLLGTPFNIFVCCFADYAIQNYGNEFGISCTPK